MKSIGEIEEDLAEKAELVLGLKTFETAAGSPGPMPEAPPALAGPIIPPGIPNTPSP